MTADPTRSSNRGGGGHGVALGVNFGLVVFEIRGCVARQLVCALQERLRNRGPYGIQTLLQRSAPRPHSGWLFAQRLGTINFLSSSAHIGRIQVEKQPKRAHPRVQTRIEARVHLPDGRTHVTGRISNLSLGGVFIEMEDPLGFGNEFDLEFNVPDGMVRCRGLVVWSTKTEPARAGGQHGMGVRLMQIGVGEMRQLEAFIASHLEEKKGGER